MAFNLKLVVLLFLAFGLLFGGNVSAGLECPAGFGDCDCDGTCETDVLTDPNNCGRCGIVCASGNCTNGFCDAVVPVLGGLVPCGRDFDDDTTLWNEKEECKLCHFVILADNIIDYLLGVVGLVAVLSLVIGGMLYVTSAGSSNLVTTAKTAFNKSLYGFVVVFIAWVAINTTMVLFGFDDPLGDGSWHKFNCDLETATPVINYYCGDGVVTNPNDDGIAEVCDPMETFAAFQNRVPGGSAASWVESIYACDPVSCTLGCVGDPLESEIGKGCYEPILADGSTGDLCQKGRYVCNFSFSSPTVVCQNTYNDPLYKLAGNYCADVYDYCCDSDLISLAATSFTKLKPAGSYRCDDQCKTIGKICIGVGLDNIPGHSCVKVIDHSGGSCAGFNLSTSSCQGIFSEFPGATCIEPGSGSTFRVGGTGCYCF